MPKGRGGRHAGVYQQKGRTKQTTATGKQKGSNAVRRAVNRQIPALKRIANGSHTLRGAWEESGGDPLQWRVAHDKGETVYTDVCEIEHEGVTGLIFVSRTNPPPPAFLRPRPSRLPWKIIGCVEGGRAGAVGIAKKKWPTLSRVSSAAERAARFGTVARTVIENRG